ncbi:4281_t:CDS:2, partial [Scutellospora calospora]
MISSLKLCREILKQPPLSTVYNVKEMGINDEFGEWCTNGIDMSDEDWERFVLNKSITTFHPCGTVKMAPESKNGVVNHRLQVYGTKNLRVVDASIFPYIPSGNTNAPTAMVAWKASRNYIIKLLNQLLKVLKPYQYAPTFQYSHEKVLQTERLTSVNVESSSDSLNLTVAQIIPSRHTETQSIIHSFLYLK